MQKQHESIQNWMDFEQGLTHTVLICD